MNTAEPSQYLYDLYDIKRFLELRGLLNEPKDNEGTEETIGELVEELIRVESEDV